MAIPPIAPPGLFTARVVPRNSTYHFVTKDELLAYTIFGLLLNVFLTLFGLTASAYWTCKTAQQPGLPDLYLAELAAYATSFKWAAVCSAVISVIFVCLQWRAKNAMFGSKSVTVELK